MQLEKLWRDACSPDSNLGDGELGPSPQKITLGSAKRLLDAMGVDGLSSFYDIGCGHGLVCFAARLYSGAALSGGLEVRQWPHAWAEGRASRSDTHYCIFENDDIARRPGLSSTWTHVYSMDKDFPPAVLDRLCSWAKSQTSWRCWASAHRWTDELLTATGAGLRKKVQVALCGSRERHTIFIYCR